MRISRITIDSFGRLRDRSIDVSEGMTVIHGPNESGKTSVMEFLRNTMVPTSKRDVYPARSRTDSGRIVYSEEGEVHEITLTQRSRGGDVPDDLSRMDPELFRSVFAMGQSDLEDSGSVTSDEMSTRFLSIPGGDGMPKAMETISDEVDSTLGKTRSSKSELMSYVREIGELDLRIAELRSKAESYGTLYERKVELERRRSIESSVSDRDTDNNAICDRYDSQKMNYAELERVRSDLNSLGDFKRVSDEDVRREIELAAHVSDAKVDLEEHESRLADLRDRLGGVDERVISRNRERMTALIGGKVSSGRSEGGHRTIELSPRPAPVGESERRRSPLVMVGAVIAVIGLVASLFSPYALALTAVGALVAVFGVRGRKAVNIVSDASVQESPSACGYEDEVADMLSTLGLAPMSTASAVSRFADLLEVQSRISRESSEGLKLRQSLVIARDEASSFYAQFSGKDGFSSCLERTDRERELRTKMGILEEAIRNAGCDPDNPVCPVERVDTDDSESNRLSEDIGRLTREMEEVLDTEELESMEDRRAAVQQRLEKCLKAGAVAYLASCIASTACDDAYSTVHPGVAATADRYLSMMTDGRYRIDLDPRRKDNLSVVDADGTKGPKQWSTGLRGQVLLAMKLAVAKELGGGRIPMILDDVLLTFDTSRKGGAVRALADVSDEMQIIMFTCDDQTRDMASRVPGVTVIELV